MNRYVITIAMLLLAAATGFLFQQDKIEKLAGENLELRDKVSAAQRDAEATRQAQESARIAERETREEEQERQRQVAELIERLTIEAENRKKTEAALVALNEKIASLSEAQAEAEDKIAALSEAQAEAEEKLASLSEAQAEAEDKIAALEEARVRQEMPGRSEGELGGEFGLPEFEVSDLSSMKFELGELDEIPRVISRVSPIYPEKMRRARLEGRVVLYFIVDENGVVKNARVESATNPALDALRKWRFKPGIKDGRKVKTRMRQPMTFSLQR